MQAQGRRGRACQSCRRRKIKCGEQTPTCHQCITSKLECSGPVTGPLIVEVNPQRGRRQYRQGESRHPGKDKGVLRRDPALPAPPVKDPGEGSRPDVSDPESPSINEVPDQDIILGALASKFQECVWIPHQRHRSVVSFLLGFAGSDQLPDLRKSIGAVSLALTGITAENWALFREGQKLYGATLKTLIRAIPKGNELELVAGARQRVQPISIELMALSVICVWYEGISSTTNPNGWIDHSWGAGRLVLTRPPEDYIELPAHAVFRTVRYMVANASLVAIQPTPFALDIWLNGPFSSFPKEPFDRLVDFMLVIPVCLSLVNQLCATGKPIPISGEVQTLQGKLLQLNQQLDRWWIDYQEQFTRNGQSVWLDIEDDFEDSSGTYHPANRRFQTDYAHECIAHYAMNRLVVALMSANLASPTDQPSYRAQALTYSALAISAVAFPEAKSTTGRIREYLGMVIVHVVIFCATPSRSHQAYVKRRINGWADPRGFRGICGAEETMMEQWRNLTAVWGGSR